MTKKDEVLTQGQPRSKFYPVLHDARIREYVLVFTAAILLSLFTVYDQIFHRVGLVYIWDEQLRFHRWVIEGTSIDPWQYRILAPYLIESVKSIGQSIGIRASYGQLFAGLRFAQNVLVFVAAYCYWKLLGIRKKRALIALPILAWGVSYSGYGSGLAFDTYFDVLFYLMAGIALLAGSEIWIIPISILAAFNRDTGILIPVLAIVLSVTFPKIRIKHHSRFLTGIIGLTAFLVVYLGIRMGYGPREFSAQYRPGIELLLFNLSNRYTYFSLFATYSIIPVLALMGWNRWPELLKRFFWLMVPVWILIHSFTAVLAEARLFLVPYTLIILPAAFLTWNKTIGTKQVNH